MKAARLEQFGGPLVVGDVADPRPGPGDVLVRTRAAAVCRTDLKIIEGGIPTVSLPRILGHELAGEIAEAGPGVDGYEPGDRVIVALDFHCGSCRYCKVAEFDHCTALRRLGIEEDGALAELVRVPAGNLIRVPAELDLTRAATIPDAVGSPYHAVVALAKVGPGDTVAVYGLGGLGLSAVQIARLSGARVIGIARTPERRRLAEQLGASSCIDPRDGAVSEQLRELTDGAGVHAFFDLVGIEGSVEQAVLSCRKGGMVVVVGYVVPRLDAPMMRVVYDEVMIRGSRSSTREDLHAAVQLVSEGRLSPVVGERVRLDDVNDALAALGRGDIVGRAVIELP